MCFLFEERCLSSRVFSKGEVEPPLRVRNRAPCYKLPAARGLK